MAQRRPAGRPSRSDRKTGPIAAAAGRLFATKGYMETSMEDVAAAARISKGGMYHYFGSKADLLYFVVSGFMDIVLEGLEEELAGAEGPVERIRVIIFRHVLIYAGHMYAAKVLLNEVHNLPAAKLKEIKAKEKRYFATIAGVLSSWLGDGLDRPTLTAVTFNLLGMCNWIYSWYDPKGAIGPDGLSRIIFDTFTRDLSTLSKGRA